MCLMSSCFFGMRYVLDKAACLTNSNPRARKMNSKNINKEKTMRTLIYFLSLSVFLTFIACSESTNGPDSSNQNQDEDAILTLLEEDERIYDQVADNSEAEMNDENRNWTGGGLAKDGLINARFGRILTRRTELNVEVIFSSDSTATAYIFRKFSGQFISLTGELNGDTLSLNRFQKPMVHNVERVFNLVKVDTVNSNRYRNWKIESISLADGKSENNSITIKEVTINADGQDPIVITEPTEYFLNGNNLFTFPRMTEVSVQVKVENTTANPVYFPTDTEATEILRLHYGRNRLGHHAKSRFTFVGKDGNLNVYEGKWTVQQFAGRHHAVIDAIDNGTIFDNDADMYPYNSATWSTPYRVKPF